MKRSGGVLTSLRYKRYGGLVEWDREERLYYLTVKEEKLVAAVYESSLEEIKKEFIEIVREYTRQKC